MDHLSANDYYSRDGKIAGTWHGALAECFELQNREVSREIFSVFQQNKNPLTGERLTCRTNKNGIRFFDAQCSAEKSVSVMSMFDERLISAHREAVQIAMDELEKFAAVRIRQGDNNGTYHYETTGKLLYATFHHDTSRSLDPQLHSHQVICNFTMDADGKFKALQEYEMIRFSSYFGRIYQNEMRRRCHNFGYETTTTYDFKGNEKGFEITGISAEIIERYSSRTREMDAVILEKEKLLGRPLTAAEKHEIAVATRDRMAIITDEEVKANKLGKLSAEEQEQLQNFHKASLNQKIPSQFSLLDIQTAIQEIVPEIFERASVVTEADIYAKLLAKYSGVMSLPELKSCVDSAGGLVKLSGRTFNSYVTVPEIIEAEKYVIEVIQQGKNQQKPFSSGKANEAIQGILNSKDQFLLLRGAAGAGKTTSLQKLCCQISGKITVLAPTNSAVSVLKSEGFSNATTVSAFLQNAQEQTQNDFLIVDEAGLCSLRTGCEILQVAKEKNLRVLFVGDSRQHKSVETGDFFRLLEEHSSIEQFALDKIYRQKDEMYRKAIQFAADGDSAKAFEALDGQGKIHECGPDYLQQAAEKYFQLTRNGKKFDSTIFVAPTHVEADRLTDSIREKLSAEGILSGKTEERQVFRSAQWGAMRLKNSKNYQPGMSLMFILNKRGFGNAGEVVTIESVKGKTLRLSNGKSVRLSEIQATIAVGEQRTLELQTGDLIQFTVNRKKEGIINGGLAKVLDDGQIQLLNEKMESVANGIRTLAPDFCGFDYGWVTTSHKSQGRTADHVIVAAKNLDHTAFYVSSSRGRFSADLYCPDKEYFHERLLKKRERLNVADVVPQPAMPEKPYAAPQFAIAKDRQWHADGLKEKATFDQDVQKYDNYVARLEQRTSMLEKLKSEQKILVEQKQKEQAEYEDYHTRSLAGKLRVMLSGKGVPKQPEGLEEIQAYIQKIQREISRLSRETFLIRYPEVPDHPEQRPLEPPRKLFEMTSPVKDLKSYSSVEQNLINYSRTEKPDFFKGFLHSLELDGNIAPFTPSADLSKLKIKPESPSQFRQYKHFLSACINRIRTLYPAAKAKQNYRLPQDQLDSKLVAYYAVLQYHLQLNYDDVSAAWMPKVKSAFERKYGIPPEQRDFPSFPPPAGLDFEQFQKWLLSRNDPATLNTLLKIAISDCENTLKQWMQEDQLSLPYGSFSTYVKGCFLKGFPILKHSGPGDKPLWNYPEYISRAKETIKQEFSRNRGREI